MALQQWHATVLFLLLKNRNNNLLSHSGGYPDQFFGMNGPFSSIQYHQKLLVRHQVLPFSSWLCAKPISFPSPEAHSPRDKAFTGG